MHIGSWGLPDLGLTEAIQKFLMPQKAFAASGGSNLFGPDQAAPPPPPKVEVKGTSTQPPGPAPAGSPSNTPNQPSNQPTFDVNAEADRQRADAERQRIERENQIRSNINSAYEPIFGELDRQIGLVPGQQDVLKQSVETLAGQQVENVNTEEKTQTGNLEGSKANEQANAKSAFTDLADNIRNLLQGAQFYLGSKGAADSSASQAASEAIIQSADKTRGKILTVRNNALSAIDSKISDIQQLASTQRKKIDDYKTNKLQDIVQWGIDRVNELTSQKATAQGTKAQALASLIDNTQQQFVDRLRQLDDEVFNYKSAVSQWQTQRQADLEDFKTKYQIAAQYSSNTPTQLQSIFDAIDKAFTPITSTTGGTQANAALPGVGASTTKKPETPTGLTDLIAGGLLPGQEDTRTQLQLNA